MRLTRSVAMVVPVMPVGPGWDQATGLGTPNGWNFVQAFAGD